ncbi:MAG: dolichol-phosphate mannosyltransferase [Nitrosopumilales archaeon CG_4_10_14_0_8_um_filter_34_8]|nr:MAG: dolichol-phosphate mannosyltransferase [Nitrosopumilales archaeon CG_4_10_14_0_8_um_filter_34_8]PJB97577.1 MAG: dolichol-phosphate mannosyltransferase [Nitrosopumilales archaeon CG_4_9_14_0_8_um_filter_34_10]
MPSVRNTEVSIVIPTYNESENIQGILHMIKEHLPKNTTVEAIVVDDNSPDGTGKIAEDYFKSLKEKTRYTISVINRKTKEGLSSAILKGVEQAKGKIVIVMDSDFSHPPQLIPKLVDVLKQSKTDIVVASRYLNGGTIQGWSLKRKILSKIGTIIAKKGLGIKQSDPMSGFFAFNKDIIRGINFDAIGYKFLLEMIVKVKDASIKEIPYTFLDRQNGKSKLGIKTILEFTHAVWNLYRYGKNEQRNEKRASVRFMSKAARFFSVGAIGLGVNYLMSILFTSSLNMWYLHATILGIVFSITSNFILNKYWTFEDRDFAIKRTIMQYGKFSGFSSIGALVQLGIVYYLVDEVNMSYPIALVSAVATAAFSNFILNKKWTFKEKVWS